MNYSGARLVRESGNFVLSAPGETDEPRCTGGLDRLNSDSAQVALTKLRRGDLSDGNWRPRLGASFQYVASLRNRSAIGNALLVRKTWNHPI